MPSEKSYLPVYIKADKAFQQDDSEVNDYGNCDRKSSHSPARISEPKSSPSIAQVDSQALSSASSPQAFTSQRTIQSPAKAWHALQQSKEEASLATTTLPTKSNNGEASNLSLVGEVKWEELKKAGKSWIRNPKNLAVCVWGLAVGISGALLFLVMVGFLNKQLPSKNQRNAWFEVNNQILNALFTMMCLYLHPQRCLHLVMLLRWHPRDITELRRVYCKDGTYKPNEWKHMLVIVVLLHLNCFAQYALCGLNVGFPRSRRPALGVGLCLAVAIGAPATAGIYSVLSPLEKDYYVDEEKDVCAQEATNARTLKLDRKPSLRSALARNLFCGDISFNSRDGDLVDEPQWKGGLFSCCEDPPVAVVTTLCAFCVFGWNMERLGFGNRYVHIVTFILICTAPFWILTLAAVNIDNSHVRRGLGISGIVLSAFGLLYGGFWRIQMRKTFKLPAQRWCFGKPNLTDCTQWLFCSLCSLCQEARTSESYRVHGTNFYERRAAFSDVSSLPSFSEPQSPGHFHLAAEASSPGPFKTHFPASFSFPSPITGDDGEYRAGLEPGGSKTLMHAPSIQALPDRGGGNYQSIRGLGAFGTDSPHRFGSDSPRMSNGRTESPRISNARTVSPSHGRTESPRISHGRIESPRISNARTVSPSHGRAESPRISIARTESPRISNGKASKESSPQRSNKGEVLQEITQQKHYL